MENNNICDDHHLDHDHQIGMGILLPQDVLIHQILVLLPVISLLRFKSVCKSWRALIQSSLFVHLHLNTTTTTLRQSNFGTFIFQTSNFVNSSNESKYEAFMLSSGSGSGSGGEEEEEEEEDDNNELEEELKWENLGFPLPPRYKVPPTGHDIFMVGSCNGLICIHDKKRSGDVYLWNPATRQFRLLPKSLILRGIGHLVEDFVAFGYDVETKDYKVVQITHFRPYRGDRWPSLKEYIFRVQVYSLSTDSWRLLEGINSLPAFPIQAIGLNHGVYLNGSYYFLGATQRRVGCNTILSFDFTKEIFTTIQLPHDCPLNTILTCLGEKLAVFAQMKVVEYDESDFQTYDLWVLNEHGVVKEEESWTKLHSNVPYSCGTPRGISNNGEFALINTGGVCSLINGEYVYSCKRLQLFNLVTKEVKKEFPTGGHVIRADVYKQSLVSIDGKDTVADRLIGGTM